MPRKAKTSPTILNNPKTKEWADIQHKKYTGPIQSFAGQLRCYTGVQDLGKDRIILIKPEQLNDKQDKYPLLRVIETVQ